MGALGVRDLGRQVRDKHENDALGRHGEADLEERLAHAVAGLRRELHGLGKDELDQEQREAEDRASEVGEEHLRPGGRAQIHQRLVVTQFIEAPENQHRDGSDEQAADDRRAAPAPRGTLGDLQQQADKAGAQAQCTGVVEAATAWARTAVELTAVIVGMWRAPFTNTE